MSVTKNTAKENLTRLGLELPNISSSGTPYVPYSIWNGLLTISGQVPIQNGEVKFAGKVGKDLDLESAQAAAQLCALNIIAHIEAACEGDLELVEQVLHIGGYVNAVPEFTQQSQVINSASELVNAVFGGRGKHARTSIGAGSLPRGVAVEVDAVVAIRG